MNVYEKFPLRIQILHQRGGATAQALHAVLSYIMHSEHHADTHHADTHKESSIPPCPHLIQDATNVKKLINVSGLHSHSFSSYYYVSLNAPIGQFYMAKTEFKGS